MISCSSTADMSNPPKWVNRLNFHVPLELRGPRYMFLAPNRPLPDICICCGNPAAGTAKSLQVRVVKTLPSGAKFGLDTIGMAVGFPIAGAVLEVLAEAAERAHTGAERVDGPNQVTLPICAGRQGAGYAPRPSRSERSPEVEIWAHPRFAAVYNGE